MAPVTLLKAVSGYSDAQALASTVILQKSLKEGFGLTVSEALWKSNPEYARKIGENGREHVRNNFLITRHLRDYMLLFLSLYHRENIVYL
jgi:trehalose synthase